MKSTAYNPLLHIDTLGYYLDRALNAMVKSLNKQFSEHNIDLQHSQYIVLKVLWCVDGVSQSQLSKLLGKDPAAVSRALNYLERKGYVVRKSINNKTNGIYLTEYANSHKDEIEHLADVVTDIATKGMTERQREIIIQSLTKIYDNSECHLQNL